MFEDWCPDVRSVNRTFFDLILPYTIPDTQSATRWNVLLQNFEWDFRTFYESAQKIIIIETGLIYSYLSVSKMEWKNQKKNEDKIIIKIKNENMMGKKGINNLQAIILESVTLASISSGLERIRLRGGEGNIDVLVW